MLIEAGVDIYTLSRLPGHADVRITQEVYAPLSGRFLAEQAARLGRHIGRHANGTPTSAMHTLLAQTSEILWDRTGFRVELAGIEPATS